MSNTMRVSLRCLLVILITLNTMPSLILGLKTITISGTTYSRYNQVLDDIPPDTTTLRIYYTALEELDLHLLQGQAPLLKVLDIYRNKKLTSLIGEMSFVDLEQIRMASNNLQEVPSFLDCPKLTQYTLSSNKRPLAEFNVSTLTRCTQLVTINLQASGIQHFPRVDKLNISLNHLEIKSIAIPDIDTEDLSGLTSLKTLKLEHNQLALLPDLNALTSLTTISLQSNALTQVPRLPFETLYSMLGLGSLAIGCEVGYNTAPNMTLLPQLWYLRLCFNASAPVILPADYFQPSTLLRSIELDNVIFARDAKLTNLHTISLTNCQIQNVTGDSSVSRLSLTSCEIKNYTDNSFDSFTRLTGIDLIRTNVDRLPDLNDSRLTLTHIQVTYSPQITAIPINYFSNFSKLSYVYLKYNSLKTLPPLGENIKIIRMDVTHNQISTIHPDAFKGFSCLTYLMLDYNQLQAISFFIPPTATRLYADHNNIQTIRDKDFQQNPKLRQIRLRYSALTCDQRMCFSLRGPWSSKIKLNTYPCSNPPELRAASTADLIDRLPCADEVCYTIPTIPNATSQVERAHAWYSCSPGFLFPEGVSRKMIRCDAASAAVELVQGCIRGVGVNVHTYVTTEAGEQLNEVLTQRRYMAVRVEEVLMRRPDLLSCTRLCSQAPTCVSCKMVDAAGGGHPKCALTLKDDGYN